MRLIRSTQELGKGRFSWRGPAAGEYERVDIPNDVTPRLFRSRLRTLAVAFCIAPEQTTLLRVAAAGATVSDVATATDIARLNDPDLKSRHSALPGMKTYVEASYQGKTTCIFGTEIMSAREGFIGRAAHSL